MTAICAGNASSPKAGLAEFVTLTSGALALTLQRYGAARLQFLIPLLGLPPLELGPFCATDPPAMPTFTSDEIYSLLRVGLDADYVSGLAKARDMIANMLWYDLCECDAGTLTPITNPTLPTDTPAPVLPAPSPSGACDVKSAHGLAILTTFQVAFAEFRLPAAASQYTLTMRINPVGAGAHVTVAGCELRFFDINHANMGHHDPIVQVGINNPDTVTVNVPANSFSLQVVYNGNSSVSADTFDVDLSVFCGGNIGTPTPCCPPDVSTQAYLDLILNMVTLIQRQSVPFGYVPGADHAALTDAGSIAVSGLIGVLVSVTTIPDSYGRRGTAPVEFFGLGFLTFGTTDGFRASYRVEKSTNIILPTSAGVFTLIDYDLSPGVVITITELLREP